ncbi:hypothetical protein ACC870_38185, partial [Rhizobium ruizarguesonis]
HKPPALPIDVVGSLGVLSPSDVLVISALRRDKTGGSVPARLVPQYKTSAGDNTTKDPTTSMGSAGGL